MELTRRDLLAAGGASILPSINDGKPVGWAILGLGGYATRNIMPNLRHCKSTALKAVISGTPDKAKRIAAQYALSESKIYTYNNLEAIANDPEIEVVYVITPPGTHHEFTLRALRAGKHVMCEKPMTGDLKQAIEMANEAKKLKRRLGVGYRCHFEPHNLEAVRLCREGKLGTIRYIRSDHGFTLGDWSQWHHKRAIGGFGAISEIGIYAIQAMCYLAGADPVEVIGTREKGSSKLFKEVEDSNHFTLVFPNGITGQGATSYSWNANNFRVYGNAGNITAEPATGYENHQFSLNGNPIVPNEANQWALQMDHFSECVRDPKKKCIIPGEMGLRDIRIIDAILRSADAGGKPIRL